MEPQLASLLPPALAVLLALFLKRVIPALLAAVVSGAFVFSGGAPLPAARALVADFLAQAVFDLSHVCIVGFSLLLGGMIGVMGISGGSAALAAWVGRRATTRERGQLATWCLGMVVFFDDYANSLLVGSALRPTTDRLRVSREKLAFLVDATSAPVASLALVSSWIGVEVAHISEQYAALGLSGDGYLVFLKTLPYRSYPILMLGFGLFIAFTGRDFGPMLKAERAAFLGEQLAPHPQAESRAHTVQDPEQGTVSLRNSLLPIAVLLLLTFLGMVLDGVLALNERGLPVTPRAIFENARSYLALFWACFFSGALAVSLALRTERWSEVKRAWLKGAGSMTIACSILLLAWMLSAECRALGTADYLVGSLKSELSPALVPATVFLLSALTSFSTGTSWGTMAILFPLAIPLAHGLAPGREDILLASVSSVLSGSVFGDHCSPLSDTTIMSSLSSGCDHLAHVRTQLPYAFVIGLVSVVVGELGVGFGLYGPTTALLVGLAFVALLVRGVGRRSDVPGT